MRFWVLDCILRFVLDVNDLNCNIGFYTGQDIVRLTILSLLISIKVKPVSLETINRPHALAFSFHDTFTGNGWYKFN